MPNPGVKEELGTTCGALRSSYHVSTESKHAHTRPGARSGSQRHRARLLIHGRVRGRAARTGRVSAIRRAAARLLGRARRRSVRRRRQPRQQLPHRDRRRQRQRHRPPALALGRGLRGRKRRAGSGPGAGARARGGPGVRAHGAALRLQLRVARRARPRRPALRPVRGFITALV